MKGSSWIYVCSLLCFLDGCCSSKKIAAKSWYDNEVISLHGEKISELPDSVFKYAALEELYVGPKGMVFYGIASLPDQNNNLHSLPEKICLFKHLKLIDLTFNDFDKIPDISCCYSLITLNLAFNRKIKLLDNIAVIKRMKNLKNLIVIGTNFNIEDIILIQKQTNDSLKIIYADKEYIEFLNRTREKK